MQCNARGKTLDEPPGADIPLTGAKTPYWSREPKAPCEWAQGRALLGNILDYQLVELEGRSREMVATLGDSTASVVADGEGGNYTRRADPSRDRDERATA